MGKVSSFKESGEQIEKKNKLNNYIYKTKKNSNNADSGTEPTYRILSYDPLDSRLARPSGPSHRPSVLLCLKDLFTKKSFK